MCNFCFFLSQQFASKWRELKAREDSLNEREEALKTRERTLSEREEKLKAWEKELLFRQNNMGSVSTTTTTSSNVVSSSSVTSSVVAGRNVNAHQARRISMGRVTESMTIDEEHCDTTTSSATTSQTSSTDNLNNHYFKLSDQPAAVSQPYTFTSRVSSHTATNDSTINLNGNATTATVNTANMGIATNRPPPYVPRQLPTAAPFTIYSDPVYTNPTTNTSTCNNDMPPPAAPRLYSRPVPPRPVPYTSHLGPAAHTTSNIVTGSEYSKENTHAVDLNNFKQRNKDAIYAKVHANVNQGIDRLSANHNPTSGGGAMNNAPARRALGDLPVPPTNYNNSAMDQFGSPLKKQRVQNAHNAPYSAVPTSTTVQVDLQTLLRKR